MTLVVIGSAMFPATVPAADRTGSLSGLVFVQYDAATDTTSLLRLIRPGEFEPIVSDSDQFLFDVAVSPDGQQIAFVALDRQTRTATIERMNRDGTNRMIAVGPSEPNTSFHSLSWTSTSDGFLYSCLTCSDADSSDRKTELRFYDGNMETSRVLVKNAFDGSISPDGQRVVFVRRRENASKDTDLILRGFDDSGTERIVAGGGKASQPAWSPDSKSILYYDYGNGAASGKRGFWQLALDGPEPPRFVKSVTGHADIAPRFTPDGRLILFTAVYLMNPVRSTIMSFDPATSAEFAVSPGAGQFFLGERGGLGIPIQRIESVGK
jgi:hypothetical protein